MSQTQISVSKGTIVSIQYLRAIAAAMVLFHHIGTKSEQVGQDVFASFHFGFAGVDVFFVISGFIMCFVYARTETGIGSFGDFWKRRFVRIVPLYWAMSLVALAVFLLAPGQVNSSGGSTVILKSFFLIRGEGERFLISNGWTLSYEMYFYALFLFPFLVSNKFLGSAICMLLLVGIASSQLFGVTSGFFTSPLILEFSFGIAAYLLYVRYGQTGRSALGALCAVAGSAGLILQPILTEAIPDLRFVTAGIPAALVVYGLVVNEGWVRELRIPILGKLGDSSYSMYLSHPFPLKAAGLCFSYLGLATHGAWVETLYWASVAVGVLAVGHLVYLYMELPLIKWTKELLAKKEKHAGETAVAAE